jgi:hypothetical protein
LLQIFRCSRQPFVAITAVMWLTIAQPNVSFEGNPETSFCPSSTTKMWDRQETSECQRVSVKKTEAQHNAELPAGVSNVETESISKHLFS